MTINRPVYPDQFDHAARKSARVGAYAVVWMCRWARLQSHDSHANVGCCTHWRTAWGRELKFERHPIADVPMRARGLFC